MKAAPRLQVTKDHGKEGRGEGGSTCLADALHLHSTDAIRFAGRGAVGTRLKVIITAVDGNLVGGGLVCNYTHLSILIS